MYIVCLIFAALAFIGCMFVTLMFFKNKKYIEQEALEAARQLFRAKERHDDHTATR
ncbi:hypothetical protein [Herbaspirillum rubrisubalbicans]|uniref:hypothetical protein n=1 Tax=Herbaspirillum rubrisubalbicans TaxID=80842 RepID=UPI0015C53D50|nr:hypothetical protein [Herbaspirillum rubrisubalbicans]